MTESGGEGRGNMVQFQIQDPPLELCNMEETISCLNASGSSTFKDLPQEAFVAAHSIWKTN